MAAQTWTLFDQTTNEHIGYQKLGGHAEFSAHRGGLSEGVEMVSIDAGKLKFHVLPTRGMSLWKASYDGESIGWKSPTRGPVHPSFVPLFEPSGLGWLDGFDELVVRCGLESNGAPEHDPETKQLLYPLHGKIGNKPAYKAELTLDEATGEIALTGWVEETRFHFLKLRMKSTIRTKVNSTKLSIEDEITNISASPAEIQMLYHVNFGDPLLDAGSRLVAPVKELVPRNAHAAEGIGNWNDYAAETAGYEERVYFANLFANASGDTQTLLKNAHGTRGAALHFNTKLLPCFTLWKNTTSFEDGFVTGIEPGTNFPNPRTFEGEHGRVIKLAGGASTTLGLGFEYCPDEQSVQRVEKEISELQTAAPKVHSDPQPTWCHMG